jgi:hypothetical protein
VRCDKIDRQEIETAGVLDRKFALVEILEAYDFEWHKVCTALAGADYVGVFSVLFIFICLDVVWIDSEGVRRGGRTRLRWWGYFVRFKRVHGANHEIVHPRHVALDSDVRKRAVLLYNIVFGIVDYRRNRRARILVVVAISRLRRGGRRGEGVVAVIMVGQWTEWIRYQCWSAVYVCILIR